MQDGPYLLVYGLGLTSQETIRETKALFAMTYDIFPGSHTLFDLFHNFQPYFSVGGTKQQLQD